jgi:hypothetical protein
MDDPGRDLATQHARKQIFGVVSDGRIVHKGLIPSATEQKREGMVPDVGIELTTYRLQGGCSTAELIRHDLMPGRIIQRTPEKASIFSRIHEDFWRTFIIDKK